MSNAIGPPTVNPAIVSNRDLVPTQEPDVQQRILGDRENQVDHGNASERVISALKLARTSASALTKTTTSIDKLGAGLHHIDSVNVSTATQVAGGTLAVTGGLTVLSAGLELYKAHSEVKAGETAKTELKNATDELRSTKKIDAETAQKNVKILRDANNARSQMVGVALKGGVGGLQAIGGTTAALGVAAGSVVTGAATGLALTAMGAMQVNKAVKMEQVGKQKTAALNPNSSNDAVREHAKKILDAKESVKESRATQIAKNKSAGTSLVVVGIAMTALAIAGLLAAPIVLPVLGIGLGIGMGASVVMSTRAEVHNRHSEQKIQKAIDLAINKFEGNEIGSLDVKTAVEKDIKSKNTVRDMDRLTKINASVGAVRSLLDELCKTDQSETNGKRADIINFLTQKEIVGSQTENNLIKEVLNNMHLGNTDSGNDKLVMDIFLKNAI